MNAIGQRTDVAQSGTAFAAAHTLDWAYNARGELTEEDHSDNGRGYPKTCCGHVSV